MTETAAEAEREGRVIAAVPEDTYAHRLMLVRAHAGHLSIREAAEKCGLNYASWANWERGARSRSMVEDAEVISDEFGIDRDWLLHGGALTRPSRIRKVRIASLHRGTTHPGVVRRPRRVDGARRRIAA